MLVVLPATAQDYEKVLTAAKRRDYATAFKEWRPLAEPMVHYSYRTTDDVFAKMRRYALASADARRRDGVKGGLGAATRRSTLSFLRAYFLQAGLLDGQRGFVAAVFKSQETFWRYLAAGWEKPS
ncbi:MAG: hypothetical protein V3S92_00745 [Alphaproteobacteria bacterium]